MQIREDEGGHGAFTSPAVTYRNRRYEREMIREYSEFPALAGVYLEDSYVLAVAESTGRLTFELDAALTPEHPAYHPPHPGEQHCYAYATLTFGDVTRVEWLDRRDAYSTDATGERDFGNIDGLVFDTDCVVVEGDWGRIQIFGGWIRFEVGGNG